MTFGDWTIVGGYLAVALAVGVIFARRAGKSLTDFFLSGRSLPWWVVGTSMAATTYAADTPLAITEYVRTEGIWRNWFWWTWVLGHVLSVVVFSRLWRRAKVLTDNELIELRYAGRPAAVLRAFKASYFSTLFNFVIIGWVTAAMSTIVSAFVDIRVEVAVVVCLAVAWCYSFLGGMWGVAVTDVIQFFITLVASVIFAALALSETGGTSGLVESLQASGNSHLLDFFPSPASPGSSWPAFLVFLSVMWWATHDADGGGYIIQRMMSAKNERHAYLGTLWFAVAHYVLRLWPWIIIALVSVVVLPGLSDHRAAYPELLARILPAGLKGLCLASFLAAYMSTIDTHLNWGAAYLINDIYKRFFRPEASERHYVLVSRLASLVLVVVGGAIALSIERITAAWEFVWAMGAGLGPVIVLRWFWWRINAWSEISALAASLTIAVGLLIHGEVTGEPLAFHIRALVVVTGSVLAWTLVTFFTRPEPRATLQRFCERVRPFGAWPFAYERSRAGGLALLTAWAGGVAMLYGGMFFLGNLLLGETVDVVWTGCVAALGAAGLAVGLRKVAS